VVAVLPLAHDLGLVVAITSSVKRVADMAIRWLVLGLG
jgi:hypothetical protein